MANVHLKILSDDVPGGVGDDSAVEAARVLQSVLRHVRAVRQRCRSRLHGQTGYAGRPVRHCTWVFMFLLFRDLMVMSLRAAG